MHYNQPQRRRARFYNPPNTLKQKVGAGGLSADILDKAQQLIENNAVDIRPWAEIQLERIRNYAQKAEDGLIDAHQEEEIIQSLLHASMQLKANGGMFHYPLITKIADRLLHFLEVVERLDADALEIVMAFHTTLQAVLHGQVKDADTPHARALLDALVGACTRYFKRNAINEE
ncbi:MAG: hypothetical protein KDJ15_00665 [Alphaproteobacteria bacterium]|nr:hypothetical protein [Alphaproteobacteria bacterium]